MIICANVFFSLKKNTRLVSNVSSPFKGSGRIHFFIFFLRTKKGRTVLRAQKELGAHIWTACRYYCVVLIFWSKHFFCRGEGGRVHFHEVTFFKPQHLLKFQWISYQIRVQFSWKISCKSSEMLFLMFLMFLMI